MRNNKIIFKLASIAVFISLEIAAIALVRHNGDVQNVWFLKGSQAFRGFVWGTTERWADYFSLSKQNDSLAKNNMILTAKLLSSLEEIDALRQQIVSEEQCKNIGSSYGFIAAKITKISNNSQHNFIILDKGYSSGVEVGDGVIVTKGAIGIVEAVSENFSYAISFKNTSMNLSTRLGMNGPVGSLRWDGKSGNNAILSEIPHHIEFHKQDTVYTSGYSNIFPADIPIGTTVEATLKDGATYDIKVALFEDFSTIRYVSILKNKNKKEISDLEDAAQ